jgi:AraC-like DNA-binding protein/quercetin dioxygenase-like cupin family protein
MNVVGVFETRNAFVDTSPSPLGRVRGAGMNAASRGVSNRRYHSFALVFVVSGAGTYADALGTRCEISAGDAIVVFPGLLHSYGPEAGGQWDEIYVIADGPAFQQLEQVGVLDRAQPVHSLKPAKRWQKELELLLEAPRPTGRRGRAVETCNFARLLTESLIPGEKSPTWFERGQAMLGSDLGRPVDLPTVAHAAGMSYESFRKRFQAAAGQSPRAYRESKRVDVARELLQFTSLTHRVIAAHLGYSDEFHFSRRFKMATGVPPSTYRTCG